MKNLRHCFHKRRLPKGWPLLLLLGALPFLTALTAAGGQLWPDVSGAGAVSDGKLLADFSHAGEGYFTAATASPGGGRLKLRVVKDDITLTYDLNQEGRFEVFPLQLGNGSYEVSLYENVGAKKYSQEGKAVVDAQLADENAAFLIPNQYVNYTENSAILPKAQELSASADEKQMYEAICAFMSSEFLYDFVKAVTVSPGELPDIEGSYEKKMGICQDLSAIMVGMLRFLGIHARLMVGYADDNYHAWTTVVINGKDEFFDPTAALGAITLPGTYTVERYY